VPRVRRATRKRKRTAIRFSANAQSSLMKACSPTPFGPLATEESRISFRPLINSDRSSILRQSITPELLFPVATVPAIFGEARLLASHCRVVNAGKGDGRTSLLLP